MNPAEYTPLLHLVLFSPEIPQNTGNIGRMCAFSRCRLHLIRPLGFELNDRNLRRSGMDYWKALDWLIHADWQDFRNHPDSPSRLWLMTTHARRCIWNADFLEGDGVLFGNEGHGCPDWLHKEFADQQKLRIPSFNPDFLRSLNLSTAAGITAYEALRQIDPASNLTSKP